MSLARLSVTSQRRVSDDGGHLLSATPHTVTVTTRCLIRHHFTSLCEFVTVCPQLIVNSSSSLPSANVTPHHALHRFPFTKPPTTSSLPTPILLTASTLSPLVASSLSPPLLRPSAPSPVPLLHAMSTHCVLRAVQYALVSLLCLLLLSCDVALSSAPHNHSSNITSSSLSHNMAPLNVRVVGDPMFSGLRGQQYQVHGVDGAIYNLISDSTVQVNSQFIFLSGPRPCPIIPSTGHLSVACFAHPGSYLSNLALRTNMDDRLVVEAGDAAAGFASVELNHQLLNVGDTATIHFADHTTGTVHRTSTHELYIVASLYQIDIDNSDSFINLRSVAIRADQWTTLRSEAPHGLLGQTWKVRGKGEGVIEGKVDDYMIEDDDLFGTQFMYNRFELSSSFVNQLSQQLTA